MVKYIQLGIVILLLAFFSNAQAGKDDCEIHILKLQAQLSLINKSIRSLDGAELSTSLLSGDCSEDRRMLAQAVYDAMIQGNSLANTKRDPLESQRCDIFIKRESETKEGYCWVKP